LQDSPKGLHGLPLFGCPLHIIIAAFYFCEPTMRTKYPENQVRYTIFWDHDTPWVACGKIKNIPQKKGSPKQSFVLCRGNTLASAYDTNEINTYVTIKQAVINQLLSILRDGNRFHYLFEDNKRTLKSIMADLIAMHRLIRTLQKHHVMREL
jgi:hypothetical protein